MTSKIHSCESVQVRTSELLWHEGVQYRKLTRITESIRMYGLHDPVHVVKVGGQYLIIDGVVGALWLRSGGFPSGGAPHGNTDDDNAWSATVTASARASFKLKRPWGRQ